MGNALNARQQDRTDTVHRVRLRTGSPARVQQKITKDAERRPRPGQATTARTEKAHGLNPAHLGSDFEDFLKEEGSLKPCTPWP